MTVQNLEGLRPSLASYWCARLSTFGQISAAFWVTTLVGIGIGMMVGGWLETEAFLLDFRAKVNQLMVDASPLKLSGTHTAIIEIRKTDLFDRTSGHNLMSISRLGEACRRLDQFEAAVVAIDLNLSVPLGDSKEDRRRAEFSALSLTLRDIGTRRFVVLPQTLTADSENIHPTHLEDLHVSPAPAGIRFGYINFPQDMRYVPSPVLLSRNPQIVDSFAFAIAKAKLAGGPDNHYVNNGYDPKNFSSRPPMAAVLSASSLVRLSLSELLDGDPSVVKPKIQGRAVLIGGVYPQVPGKRADSYKTGLGAQPGIWVHASHTESLLAERVYRLAPSVWLTALKFVCLLILAAIVATSTSTLTKLGWIAGAVLLNLIAAYLLFTNAGLAADVTIPILLILAHVVVDQVNHWRVNAARKGP